MNYLYVTVLGIGFGIGCFLVLRSMMTQRQISLQELAFTVESEGHSLYEERYGQQSKPLIMRMAMAFIGSSDRLQEPDFKRILRLTGVPVERYAVEKLSLSLVGMAFPIAGSVMLGYVPVPIPYLLALAIVSSIAGYRYPDLPLAEKAAQRQQEFSYALGAYLDFVTVMLAGGAGTTSALQAAAEAGDGWPFVEIRQAISKADAIGVSMHEAFEELSDELGIPELGELAASIMLAGGHGAKVKDSLIAKADSLRATQAADLEARAEYQTERMLIPVVVMVAGIVLFVGYGAVMVVLGVGA